MRQMRSRRPLDGPGDGAHREPFFEEAVERAHRQTRVAERGGIAQTVSTARRDKAVRDEVVEVEVVRGLLSESGRDLLCALSAARRRPRALRRGSRLPLSQRSLGLPAPVSRCRAFRLLSPTRRRIACARCSARLVHARMPRLSSFQAASDGRPIVMPTCGDGLGARLIEAGGFELQFLAGYALAATCALTVCPLGLPMPRWPARRRVPRLFRGRVAHPGGDGDHEPALDRRRRHGYARISGLG